MNENENNPLKVGYLHLTPKMREKFNNMPHEMLITDIGSEEDKDAEWDNLIIYLNS